MVDSMSALRRPLGSYRKISWLLVTALLIQFFSQLQFHLHHADLPEAGVHDHTIDFHVFTDHNKDEHVALDQAHELAFVPDVLVKKDLNDHIIFIVVIWLLLLIPIIRSVVERLWLSRIPLFHNPFYRLPPHLRAPPQFNPILL